VKINRFKLSFCQ